MIEAEREKGQAGQGADHHAGRQLHEQVPLDLGMDLVERLHRDLLLAEARPGELDHLAPEGVAGGEQEEGDEDDERGLAEQGEQAERAGPEIVLDVQAGLFDDDVGDATQRRRQRRRHRRDRARDRRCSDKTDDRSRPRRARTRPGGCRRPAPEARTPIAAGFDAGDRAFFGRLFDLRRRLLDLFDRRAGIRPGFCIERRSFCATSGRVSISALASSLIDQAPQPRPETIAASSSPAPAARGRRQRSSRSTTGVSA